MSKKEIICQGEELFQLIPQRPPMVMIDRFYGIKEDTSWSGLTVTPDNLFCRDGVLQETGIIEHIAQSAAARVGYIYMLRKEHVPLGFIGSVEKMKIFRLPSVGAELYTSITIVQEVFDITLITAKVKENDELLAECRMKIYLKKE
ncbi:MAG: hydroxymyristoyl-ACP dehydratase [Phocaeicola sp.]|uniref:hydroxymyristoyl-ACP dehydratase n=1 Tax=Phocaeicola sp. TaxID=2773926 RepID=UPI0023C76CE5|nr:hydroxymyristoyl-ACP dehydratase [Phocaeicola sp.]MDE5678507.1 hydroxymyristoyl-ACP dehydratase [Phocaeicola sp.]MDE6180568.1 hydroxymyristoyl-ACP dehydratase [Phocaeicola sp.]